jgi:hypothetical protein
MLPILKLVVEAVIEYPPKVRETDQFIPAPYRFAVHVCVSGHALVFMHPCMSKVSSKFLDERVTRHVTGLVAGRAAFYIGLPSDKALGEKLGSE